MKIIILSVFALLFLQTQSAKILGIFNMPAYSHFVLGETLLKELARQGHEVTMISAFGQKTPVKNYRDIVLVESKKAFQDHLDKGMDFYSWSYMPVLAKLFMITKMSYGMIELALENKDVQELINSDEKFDLIIIESFLNEVFYGFAHKFKAPVIALSTSDTSVWSNRLTANPAPSAYVVEPISSYSPRMTICERFTNLVTSITQELIFNLYSVPKHNALMHRYFPEAPHINDLIYNTSFVLVNSHPAQSAPTPLTPNMKQIGGYHIKTDQKLPDDIKKFLDESKEGVIYFALGSNLKSANLPAEKLQDILAAFKRWGKPILWKFEAESLPNKPDNIKIASWLPQPAVLAHPNVKAFISHGGKLSIMEATYFGVPIIGIPIFAEQPYNVRQVEYAGNGLKLEFSDINAETLYNSLVEITSNKRYDQEAKIRSQAMRSGKLTAMEEAVHWIEYVVKFKGAAHLRSHGINLMWYERMMVDVGIIVAVAFFVVVKILKSCCKRCYKKVCNKSCKPGKSSKTKTQ